MVEMIKTTESGAKNIYFFHIIFYSLLYSERVGKAGNEQSPRVWVQSCLTSSLGIVCTISKFTDDLIQAGTL